MANSATIPVSAADQLVNGVKFIGDVAVLPGIGQIIEGSLGKGVLYGVTGVAAQAIVGPWGWIATGLDSYSVSSSGKHLWELFGASRAADSPTSPKSASSGNEARRERRNESQTVLGLGSGGEDWDRRYGEQARRETAWAAVDRGVNGLV